MRGRQTFSSRRWGYFRMSTVTRLFSWRPSGLSEPSGLRFGATGSRAPKPDVAESCCRQLLTAHEPCLDRCGASLRQAQIIGVLTQRIGVAADSDTPVRLGSDDVGQIMQRGSSLRAQVGLVEIEENVRGKRDLDRRGRFARIESDREDQRGLRKRQALFREGDFIMRHADGCRDRRSGRGRGVERQSAATSPPARASYAPRRFASRWR